MDTDVAEPLGPGDPREIGQFTVIGVLGAGGMGEVYLGTREGRYVAVKRVKPRLVSGERFNREVAILHRVPFGVAPSLLASDSTAPEPWFATEYVPGLTVDEAVRFYGSLAADALWLLLAETAAHLHAVHEAGIVHRDLKPANLMLVRDGVKLIDFGIALAGDQSRLTRTGATSGTRGFTAPEQEAGERDVTSPADVYSLAATLVYAASARLPGMLPDISTIRALDAELAAVIEPCFAADPEARPTAAELVAAARTHADAASPSWPAPVMERIAKRRAFAATPVSVIDTVLPPDPEVETEPEPGPTQDLADNGKAEAGRRRPRFLVPLAAVAVFCAVVAGVLAMLASSHRDGPAHPSSAASGAGLVPIAGTQSSSAGLGGSTPHSNQPTAPGATPSGTTTQPAGSSSNGGTGPGSGNTTPAGSTASSSKKGGGGATSGRPVGSSTPPSSTPGSGPAKPGPSPTASSIPAVNSSEDPARVPNSEADVYWIGNDAGCSAWLDTDGSGNLAGVLNTSLMQSCVAELIRSDGMDFTFSASHYAEKTNFLPDTGYTMQVCVWVADAKTDEKCSPQFGMSGTTPIQK